MCSQKTLEVGQWIDVQDTVKNWYVHRCEYVSFFYVSFVFVIVYYMAKKLICPLFSRLACPSVNGAFSGVVLFAALPPCHYCVFKSCVVVCCVFSRVVARVIQTDPKRGVLVNYAGWSSQWDEWLPANSNRIAAHGTFTKGKDTGPSRAQVCATPSFLPFFRSLAKYNPTLFST